MIYYISCLIFITKIPLLIILFQKIDVPLHRYAFFFFLRDVISFHHGLVIFYRDI
ncbi:hypothetical protein C1645_603408 [Glomus cerebriforme]|uniref:Uncharacterized protein n=1 Tax=Glomus cerebriforme TaxID=658196 RepID=A0A397TFN6_9GLOM|nr:hypothetical protein C1645_603408 [Glomus cerebriforme]